MRRLRWLSPHGGGRERLRCSRLLLLLLHLLLALLQLLQELLRRFHATLSEGSWLRLLLILWLLLVGLIIDRVRSVLWHLAAGVIAGCVRVLCSLRHHSRWRSRVRRHHGVSLLSGLLPPNRTRDQHHALQSVRIGRRSQENVVEMRAVQQRGQYIAGGTGPEFPHNPLRRIARSIDYRSSLAVHGSEDVT